MIKKIFIFLWGALEASLIWLVCVTPVHLNMNTPVGDPRDVNAWVVFPIIVLTFSSIFLIIICVKALVDHWDDD